MSFESIVLAGGGHTHSLLLRRWAMNPDSRPGCEITLINRSSTTLYSGMLPGLISGHYSIDEVEIDLRRLTQLSGVGLIVAEIVGLDLINRQILLDNRPPINFQVLSLNVGCQTFSNKELVEQSSELEIMPIKPVEKALSWLQKQDEEVAKSSCSAFTIVGSGFTAIEVALALRNRWPSRKLFLKLNKENLQYSFEKVLAAARVEIIYNDEDMQSPALFCTGINLPEWLKSSELPINPDSRILTSNTFQVQGNPSIFATGDCAVIKDFYCPPSGVFAVKSSKPLARNLESLVKGLPLKNWYPPIDFLQLIGFQKTSSQTSYSIASWNKFVIGPSPFLWNIKERIDRRFMQKFNETKEKDVALMTSKDVLRCRGCASKLPADLLKTALMDAGFVSISNEPKDAVEIVALENGNKIFQTVDSFPALVSDPWLNGRISALHASSDLWASGAKVETAQALITLPIAAPSIQKELLSQTLSGIESVLKSQGACLIGGHTNEARSIPPTPNSLGVQVGLCLNGRLVDNQTPFNKGPLQKGDSLLLGGAIGTGVLFAAAMAGQSLPKELDQVLNTITSSRKKNFDTLVSLSQSYQYLSPIHACTDVTGFGLLGHLGEMIELTNRLNKDLEKDSTVNVQLYANSIPVFDGALLMLKKGFYSTLSPANRSSFKLLNTYLDKDPIVKLVVDKCKIDSLEYKALMELIIDPQTCGPLLISCTELFANKLLDVDKSWHKIGLVI